MKSAEVKNLVATGENASVEFKRAKGGVPADFWASYAAFANTDGGTIILGVREKDDGSRVIEGLSDAEKIIADLWNAANNPDKVSANVLFNESVYAVKVGGKSVVVVEVPRAERTARPVYVGADVFKGAYRRNGEGDYHCSRETVEGMIRDKCAETADNCEIGEMTIDGLDEGTIRRYRILFSQLRPGHVWSTLANDAFLMKIGAAVRGHDGAIHPTLAGLVCFGDFNEITNVLPYFFLDYREHLTADVRWTDRVCSGDATWSGNVFDFFFRINQPITSGVRVPFRIGTDNVTRENDTSIHKALREVLANALIHADYHGRRGIVIDKYPRRLEVSNPGTLRMSKSVAIAGGTSDARNGKIFNIFSLVHIGERSGMGLSSLYGVWEREKFVMPTLEESYEPDRLKVTVECEFDVEDVKKMRKEVGVMAAEEGVIGAEVREKNAEVREKAPEVKEKTDFDILMGAYRLDFQKSSHRIFDEICKDPYLDTLGLTQMLGVSEATIWRSIRAMKAVGLLVREGGDKGGRWIVKGV